MQSLREALYAHMLIVVAFLVVTLFGFLVITRHHEGVERWYCSRMKATSLPDLPIPTRSLNSNNRPKLFRSKILCKTEKNLTTISIWAYFPFSGRIRPDFWPDFWPEFGPGFWPGFWEGKIQEIQYTVLPDPEEKYKKFRKFRVSISYRRISYRMSPPYGDSLTVRRLHSAVL